MVADQDILDLLQSELGEGWTLEDYDAGGAMQNAGLAVHFKATSNKGQTAHVKVYLSAKPSDSPEKKRRAGPERLNRLYQRFNEIRLNKSIPSVPIHAIARTHDALVLVMADAKPLSVFIADDPNCACQRTHEMIETLATDGSWLHFDLCPANSAITPAGDFCLIDLESIYLVSETTVLVSEPLTKANRIPRPLRRNLVTSLNDGTLGNDLATRFHNHQVARLAMDMTAKRELDGAAAHALRKCDDLSNSLWERHFTDPDADCHAPDLIGLIKALSPDDTPEDSASERDRNA